MIEVLLPRTATDHRSSQSEAGHTPLKLKRSLARRCSRQNSKALELSRVVRYSCRNQIVRLARKTRTLLRLEVVQGWRRHGKHLNVYSAFIHQCQTAFAQIFEPLPHFASIKAAGPFVTDS